MNNKTIKATAVLIGTTVGAGFFGIPYTVTKVGFLPGMIYLLILGLLTLLLNLIYGEVILRTPGDHQLTGYGQIYWGKIGKTIATVGLFSGLYGALLAYLIKIGGFVALVLNINQPLIFSLIFFILASSAILLGLKTVAKLELVLVSLMLLFIVILALTGFPHLQILNFKLQVIGYEFLFPYGVILFALSGYSAIPEMEEVLRTDHRQLKKAILVGTLIPLIVYVIFTVTIVGISGRLTSEDAISSLVLFLPNWIVKFGAGLGILTMSTSYLALGYVLSEVWHRDFRIAKIPAFILAVGPSLILFLLGARSFISVLELAGAITGGLTGILIISCYLKAKHSGKKVPDYSLGIPKILLLILAVVFMLGLFSPFF